MNGCNIVIHDSDSNSEEEKELSNAESPVHQVPLFKGAESTTQVGVVDAAAHMVMNQRPSSAGKTIKIFGPGQRAFQHERLERCNSELRFTLESSEKCIRQLTDALENSEHERNCERQARLTCDEKIEAIMFENVRLNRSIEMMEEEMCGEARHFRSRIIECEQHSVDIYTDGQRVIRNLLPEFLSYEVDTEGGIFMTRRDVEVLIEKALKEFATLWKTIIASKKKKT